MLALVAAFGAATAQDAAFAQAGSAGTRAEQYAKQFGVTQAEADRRLALQDRASDLNRDLKDALGDRYAGLWFDNDSGRWGVGIVREADRQTVVDALEERGIAGDTDVKLVKHSSAKLERARQRVQARLQARGAGSEVTAGISDRANVVSVISRHAQGSRGNDIARQEAAAEADGVARAEVDRAGIFTAEAAQSQYCTYPNCTPPLRAAVSVHTPTVGCSSGFVVRRYSAYLLSTAGHCVENTGTTKWRATSPASGTRDLGARDRVFYGSLGDFGTINVEPGSFWLNHPPPLGIIAQWGNNHAQPVRNWTWTGEGQFICRSGATSQTRCGNVWRRTVTLNYGGRAVGRMTVTQNGCASPGDSGGPVFGGNTAFGITAARMGGQCGSGTEAGFAFNEIGDILWDTGTHLEVWTL